MELKDRLKLAMSDPKVTGKALADACKVKSPSVSEWLSGETKSLSMTNLLTAAKFLNVSVEWLATGVGLMRKYKEKTPQAHPVQEPHTDYNVQPVPTYAQIPVLSWVAAGEFCDANEAFPDGAVEDWIPNPVRTLGRVFALRVRGESMSNPSGKPSFSAGDIIYCDPDKQAEHKSLVVVRLDDEKEATFKRLLIEGDTKMLEALNPSWPERIIKINGNATICGVVFGRYNGF